LTLIGEKKKRFILSSPRIMYIQYINPGAYPPLEQSSEILAQVGWQVMFIGIDSFGTNPLKFPVNSRITVKQMAACSPGWQQKVHYALFCLWIITWILRWRPQWIYASDLFSCPIAYFLSFFPSLSLIYHEHDSPEANPSSKYLKFCLIIRKQLVRRSAVSILPNQHRADIFDKAVDNLSRSLCVWNCPRKKEIAVKRLPSDGKILRVLFHGSIVPERLPLTILHALSRLPYSVKLRIVGYETNQYSSHVRAMQEMSEKLNINDRVEFISAIPRNELLTLCQKSDVGLSFMPVVTEDINLKWMTGASNKAFDYLACGLPILVSSLSDWEKMYVEPGYALAANPEDPDSIASALLWYLEHPKEMRYMGDQGRQKILHEWNYETQFKKIKDLLDKDLLENSLIES
jgi:glycosyltransferase involved in cell wall biosynthesis